MNGGVRPTRGNFILSNVINYLTFILHLWWWYEDVKANMPMSSSLWLAESRSISSFNSISDTFLHIYSMRATIDFHGIENVDEYPIRIVIADGEAVSGGIDRHHKYPPLYFEGAQLV